MTQDVLAQKLPVQPIKMGIERPSPEEVEAAIRTLIRATGDNPLRGELLNTTRGVQEAYKAYFSGYDMNPEEFLQRTFDETDGYDEPVTLRDIAFTSHCECHMLPFSGVVHISYLPTDRVVGISKLARLVDVFARRLQNQRSMTEQIANTLDSVLSPDGVGVIVQAQHACLSLKGEKHAGSEVITSCKLGTYQNDLGGPNHELWSVVD
jgi:GTP cyclohydrolase IA